MAEDHTICEICGEVPKHSAVVLTKAVTLVTVNQKGQAVGLGKTIAANRVLCSTHPVEDAAAPRDAADILGQGGMLAHEFGNPVR